MVIFLLFFIDIQFDAVRVFLQGLHPFPRRPAGTTPFEDQSAIDTPRRRHIGSGPPRQFTPDGIPLPQRQGRPKSHIIPGVMAGTDIGRLGCLAIAMETARRSPIHFPLNTKTAIEQAGMAVDAIRFPGHNAQASGDIGFIPRFIGHVITADRVWEDISQGQAGLGFPKELLGQEPCFIWVPPSGLGP